MTACRLQQLIGGPHVVNHGALFYRYLAYGSMYGIATYTDLYGLLIVHVLAYSIDGGRGIVSQDNA